MIATRNKRISPWVSIRRVEIEPCTSGWLVNIEASGNEESHACSTWPAVMRLLYRLPSRVVKDKGDGE